MYKERDKVIFTLGDRKLTCYIRHSHISHSPSNEAIFRALGVDKQEFCRKAYGYAPSTGVFPAYKSGDMEAANRVIRDLKDACNAFNSLSKTTDGMYKRNDKVVFVVKGKPETYTVQNRYLAQSAGINSKIFKDIGLNSAESRKKFAWKAYGYEPTNCGGDAWPECRSNDIAALNRLIDAIQQQLSTVTPVTPDRSYLLNVNEANPGDYLYSNECVDGCRRVGSIVRVVEIEHDDYEDTSVIRYDNDNGRTSRCTREYQCNFEFEFRYATEIEILASKYANEYKSLIRDNPAKSVNYEVQSKSKAVSKGHRGKSISPRRSAIRVTSASGLIGNEIKIVTRRSKIGRGKISSSLLAASRY